ncbi:MAG: hypothetical protein A2219_03585 [Elusimicrobia bacterium RIFOXYA2_FULL_50_26]|nr:MAG: hypothetical protein A2219_03585 [Elusimicrobia bacterium RIFOXYA2_FULL_50_26]OGS25377.1 MAG: hypothetical protein A2314_06575 [Elusimicrobia bacterium RIFOXYB2_FULL_50_12]
MSTNSLLVNFAGFPSAPRMLVPDNGLANLAGALLAAGHRTRILDYATADTVKALYPYEYKDRLQEVLQRIMRDIKGGSAPSPADMEQFHSIDYAIEKRKSVNVGDIARDIAAYIRNNNIDFVGFKLWMGDGFEGSMTIARELKKNFPALPVFAGGPHVDWFGEKILECADMFDVLVCGEGEEVIVQLADYVMGRRVLENIPNLLYRKRGVACSTPRREIADLNALAAPVYDEDVYPAMKGNKKLKFYLTDESRGCPNKCAFCLHPAKSGGKWRMKSATGVVNEMERIMSKHGSNVFRFAGSNTPMPLALEIAREIIRRNLNVRYIGFANSGVAVSREEFALLKRSGCFGFWFGIESGNQEMLDKVMNKKVKVEQLREKMKACKEAGIHVTGSVIVPAPGETGQSKQDTLRLLADVMPDSIIAEPPVVVPGTAWDTDAEKYNIVIPDRKKYVEHAMFYKMKLLYPPNLLPSFPYLTIDGKSMDSILQEAGAFNRDIERQGILTQVTTDTALLATYAGTTAREFRDNARQWFLSGDYEKINGMVATINENIERTMTNLV